MKKRREDAASSNSVSRRKVLRLGATAVVGAAVGPFVMRVAGAADAFSWQRFKGSNIFVQFTKNPWTMTIEEMIPDFVKQTGIKVKYAILPEIQARQKMTVEFTAGSGGIDAWYSGLGVEKRRFWKSGWYLDLRKFLNDPTMTAPDYDWNGDFPDTARQLATQPDGSVSALIHQIDPWVLFYRKDLFKQKGLEPPKTLAEMEDFAKRLHNPPGMYGFVARGLKNANAIGWNWVLYSMGGNFLTKDGKASINTPEAVKAIDYYAGMLRRFAPPGVVNFNWYECSSTFMQDQVAMYFDGVNFALQFEDPQKSKIPGKVGYTILPSGPGGHFSPVFGNAVAVSAQSKNQGPAYFFIQWTTSKEISRKAQLAGNGSARISVWNDPEVKAEAKMPPDWSQAYLESMKIGRAALPEIVAVTEYRDIIGVAIQKAIEGAKATEVLGPAQKEFQEVLDKTEK